MSGLSPGGILKVTVRTMAVALAYVATARLGFLLALEHTNATVVWPPAGIALAACLIIGFRVWPGIFLGAFLANMFLLSDIPIFSPSTVLLSCATAAGNTLEALAGACLVRCFLSGAKFFDRTMDTVRFILAAVISPLISATIGAAGFCVYSGDWARCDQIWLTWWLGDAVGALVFAPLLLTWHDRGALGQDGRKAAEAAVILALVLVTEVIVFGLNYPLEYLVFPLLFWTAFRFGQFEAAVMVSLVMTSFLAWTVNGRGPFAGTQMNGALLLLQSYLGVASASTLFLSTLVNSRNRAVEALRNSEETFRSIYENAPVGIFQSTADGRFIGLNSTLATMFGYSSPGEMMGEVTDIAGQLFVRPECRHAIVDSARETTGFVRDEIVYRRRDGSEFIANLYMRMLHDGGGGGAPLEGFVEEITERKRAEERLRKYHEDLETLVSSRTAELQRTNERLTAEVEERARAEQELCRAKERAEAADRSKSAFLATMSHELRTPLNSIIGFTGILLQGLGGPLNEEQTKQLTMVKKSAHHLLSLISDVLDISKIEAGQLSVSLEPFDLGDAVRKVVQSVRPLAERNGLDLSLDVADDVGSVCADERRVEQVLLNLLSNAVKFTEKGTITVRCFRDARSYVTSVTDTGIGIREEEVEGLFHPFHQIDTGLGRRYEGTGLGLFISRRLAELMGGSIAVESSPGKGSTFSLALPAERGAA